MKIAMVALACVGFIAVVPAEELRALPAPLFGVEWHSIAWGSARHHAEPATYLGLEVGVNLLLHSTIGVFYRLTPEATRDGRSGSHGPWASDSDPQARPEAAIRDIS